MNTFVGRLLSSALHPTLDALQCTSSVSLINFKWNFLVRSESLNLQSTPHTSLPYNRIGETKESKVFPEDHRSCQDQQFSLF